MRGGDTHTDRQLDTIISLTVSGGQVASKCVRKIMCVFCYLLEGRGDSGTDIEDEKRVKGKGSSPIIL